MTDERQFVNELVSAVNDYRALHQVKPLRLNKEISSVSQRWANHMARTGMFQHNPEGNVDGQPLGENCAMKWSSGAKDYRGQEAVDRWYNEINNYDFQRHEGDNTGHFTQLVWNSSREIGVGRAQSRDGKWFVVANFLPAGNYVGRYRENVFPPRQQTCNVTNSRRQMAPSSPFRPISSSQVLSDSSDDERSPPYGNRARSLRTQQQPRQQQQQQQQQQLQKLQQQLRQPKVQDASQRVDYVVLQRSTETRTENGATTKKVTETRRDRNGQLSTVVTETVEQQTTAVVNRRRAPVVQAAAPQAGTVPTRREPIVGEPNGIGQIDEFVNKVLYHHNAYRRRHGNVGGLTLSPELSKMAKRWARFLASTNSLQHSNTKYKGVDLGENIAMKESRNEKIDYTGEELMTQWYEEVKLYDFDDPESCAEACGHFTQVVWKDSRYIGVGRAFVDGGRRVYVVCYYFPPGNFIGQFDENVLRPSHQGRVQDTETLRRSRDARN